MSPPPPTCLHSTQIGFIILLFWGSGPSLNSFGFLFKELRCLISFVLLNFLVRVNQLITTFMCFAQNKQNYHVSLFANFISQPTLQL
jgi:hypothetical protein